MRPAYKKSVVGAKNRGEYVGSCKGVDCGEFVMRVMRDSGADPQYNKYEGNTLDQLHYLEDFSDDDHKKGNQVRYHHIKAGEKLQPGDIAIRNKGRGLHHTFFYVGNNMYGIDDNKNVTSFNNVVASASECGRAPMASSLMRRTLFQWYRIIDPKAPVKK
jgi:hypothetical protein